MDVLRIDSLRYKKGRQTSAFILILILIPLISGCAVHSPMSELLMFSRKKYNGKIYKARYSQAIINYSYNSLPPSVIKRFIHREHPNYDLKNVDADNRSPSISTDPIFLSSHEETMAVSAAIGLNPGGDITFKLPYSNYATLALDFVGTQEILQHRLVNSPWIGQSIGVYHRYRYYGTDFDNGPTIGPIDKYWTNEVGVRSVTLVHGGGKTQIFFYLTVAAGYNIEFRSDLISFGFSLGLF